MDKIAGLKEILALDPKNSFARYGMAMELAGRGETDAALAEFDTLLANDPDYTAGYFMAAQTLANAGRTPEAIERLKAGIAAPRAAAIAMLSARCRPCSTSWTASPRSGSPCKVPRFELIFLARIAPLDRCTGL
jgi:tetratricopeptide (TPR) repeat protein